MRGQNKADVLGALQRARRAPGSTTTSRAPARARSRESRPGPRRARSTAAVGRPLSRAQLGPHLVGRDPLRRLRPRGRSPRPRPPAARSTPSRARPARRCPTTTRPGPWSIGWRPRPASGYTLLGAPTVVADFTLPGDTSQVAARLLDVAPDGTETLVDRGLWRPATGGPTRQVFQLHPNGWTFAAGHVPKLELLAADADGSALANYARPSERTAAGHRVEARAAPPRRRAAGRGRRAGPLPGAEGRPVRLEASRGLADGPSRPAPSPVRVRLVGAAGLAPQARARRQP